MRALAPELKFRKSASIPSLKMTPPDGMSDSRERSLPSVKKPATIEACECRLKKGSRTTYNRRRSSQRSRTGGPDLPPQNCETPAAILNTDETHPVEPAPVDTSTPLED